MLRNTSFTAKNDLNDLNGKRSEGWLVDIHSHILPDMDDGSVDASESVQMLKVSQRIGVDLIVATPHFYPYKDTPERFFEKRAASAEVLIKALESEIAKGAKFPKIGLGAEVAFFSGMSRSSALESFCIEGTRLVLVEMPFERWGESVIAELFRIKTSLDLIPIIAHIDRYIQYQDKKIFSSIFDGDVLVQANTSSLESVKNGKRLLKMLEGGDIDFLGSDCHNLTDRSPDMSRAFSIIEKKLGREALCEIKKFGKYALADAIAIN